MKKNIIIIPFFVVLILLNSSILSETVFAQTEKDPESMFNQAKEYSINR